MLKTRSSVAMLFTQSNVNKKKHQIFIFKKIKSYSPSCFVLEFKLKTNVYVVKCIKNNKEKNMLAILFLIQLYNYREKIHRINIYL